jgi:hypothetical protein
MSSSCFNREFVQRSKADPRQPFTRQDVAMKCAEIMERMTGDPCTVISRGPCYHYILRDSCGKIGRG